MDDGAWHEVHKRKHRSKEDDLIKISTSVFVSNFPDRFSAKDLWNACKVYGHVVDSYIPNRRSKVGKRFGFVRFINVFDVDRLVSNLCTVWVGNYKLIANVARFQRKPVSQPQQVKPLGHNGVKTSGKPMASVNLNSNRSFASVVNRVSENTVYPDDDSALVLDDSCLNMDVFHLCLFGKVKDFSMLSNLMVVLSKEGFDGIKLKYMGGYWVMISFLDDQSKKAFQSNVSVGSWFTQLIQAYSDFTVEERVAWVEIEGVPCKWWSKNTFSRIASKWGTIINADELDDGDYHSSRLCIRTTSKRAIFESFRLVFRGISCYVRAFEIPGWVPDFDDTSEDECESFDGGHLDKKVDKTIDLELDSEVEEVPDTIFDDLPPNNANDGHTEHKNISPDPFGIYDLLNKQKDTGFSVDNEHSTPHYPPGFTPNVESGTDVEKPNDTCVQSRQSEDQEDQEEGNSGKSLHVNKNDSGPAHRDSSCSGHFKKPKGIQSGGSIIHCLEEFVRVGETMGYDMSGCIKNIEGIIVSQGVADETKSEALDPWCIKKCWGNFTFEFVHSDVVGQSGGILCVGDPNMFKKITSTKSDYFVMIRGVWIPSGKELLIISIYAPHDLREKRSLWEYLGQFICNWDGDVITMGDFNEVRDSSERFGSVFHQQGARHFNDFISKAGLVEIPLGGCSFTWCHKSTSKMSKLDRFLISDNLSRSCATLTAISLDRFLSDHRPILLRESHYDYGPIPFKFYHHWFQFHGFDKLIEDSWKEIHISDNNAYLKLMKKLRLLKDKIKIWISVHKDKSSGRLRHLKSDLHNIDSVIDNGGGSEAEALQRSKLIRDILESENIVALELAQKAKIKWALEGDENSKYYHGVVNKKRKNLAIRGVLLDGTWLEKPHSVKNAFFEHFRDRFGKPTPNDISLDKEFVNKI
ncbi:RNA-directed DNA polymerase, eukaryota, partial [Tanacetum coccineum]